MFKGVVGSGKTTLPATKDWDKDGVINVLDCEPKNPKAQAWYHELAKKGAKKLFRKSPRVKKAVVGYITEREEETEYRRETKKQERVAFREAERKERLEFAKVRAKKTVRTPTTFGSKAAKTISYLAGEPTKAVKVAKRRTKAVTTTKKTKKKKRRKVSTRKRAARAVISEGRRESKKRKGGSYGKDLSGLLGV